MLQGFKKRQEQRQQQKLKQANGHNNNNNDKNKNSEVCLDREYRASLPVISGGPLSLLAKKQHEQVFEHCALIRVNKDKENGEGDGVDVDRADDDQRGDDEIPLVVRVGLERQGEKDVKILVRLSLRDHFLSFHSAKVVLHGGAYFKRCGTSSSDHYEDSLKIGMGGAESKHEFVLEMDKPGKKKIIDEELCSKASHHQCDFNDACMLEVLVRTREDRVTVMSHSDAGERLQRRVADMYGDGSQPRGTDVTIQCQGGAKLPFYRLLLSAHSDVLCAMLDGKYLESDSGQLRMDDARPEAVSALLLLLATGQVGRGELRRHALDLYVLCDKYNISSLLPACEQEASELAAAAAARGNDRGLLRCLVTAHLHGSTMIRRAALTALANRRKKGLSLMRSTSMTIDDWEEVAEKYPELAQEIMAAMKVNKS